MRFSKAGLVAASVALFVSGVHAETQTFNGPGAPTAITTTTISDLVVNAAGYNFSSPSGGLLQFDELTLNNAVAPGTYADAELTLNNAFGRVVTAGLGTAAGTELQRVVFDNTLSGILGTSPGEVTGGAKGRFIFEKTGAGVLQYTAGGVVQSSGSRYSQWPDRIGSSGDFVGISGGNIDTTNYLGTMVARQSGNLGEFVVSGGVLQVSGAINTWYELPTAINIDAFVNPPVMTGARRTTVMGGAELDFTNTEVNVSTGASTRVTGGTGAGTPGKRYNFVQNLTSGVNGVNGLETSRLRAGQDDTYRIVVNIDQMVRYIPEGQMTFPIGLGNISYFDWTFDSAGNPIGSVAEDGTVRTAATRKATEGSIGVITGGGDILRTGAGKFTIYGDATTGTGRLVLAGGETVLASVSGKTVNEMRSINLAGIDSLRGAATAPNTGPYPETQSLTDFEWSPGVAPAAMGAVGSEFENAVANGFMARLTLANDQLVHNLQADYAMGSGVAGTNQSANVEGAVRAAVTTRADEAIIAGTGRGTTINLAGRTLTIRQDRDGVYQGSIVSEDAGGNAIAGGRLVKTGSATLALLGGGSYQFDRIDINEGTLLADAGALGSGIINLDTGGTVRIVQVNAGNLKADLTGTGTLSIGITGNVVSQTGETLAVNSSQTSGSLLVTRVQAFAGDIVVSDGVTINFTSALNNALANVRSISLQAGATGRETRIALGDSSQILNNLRGDALSRLDLGRGVATLHQTEESTFAGKVTGVGSLIKTGTGGLTFSSATSYYGATVVNEGLLSLASTGVLTNSSGLVIGGTGRVSAAGNQNVGALFGSSAATLSIDGGTLTVGLTAGRNAALANALLAGGNSVPLSSNYLGTSATALDLGNAAIGSFDTALLGAAPADVADATRLFLQNVAGLSAPDAASLAFAGTLSGNGNLAKIGAERLTLTGVNTYTGATTVQGGELRVDFDAISSTSGVAIATGGTLAINAVNAVDGAGNHDFTRKLTGTGAVNKVGDGEVTLTGDITGFTGTLNVNEGTLRFNVEQTVPTAVTVAVGATLALNTPTASAVVNYTGTIANNGTIQKDGLGKVVLVNAPAPTGSIFVNAGTLSVGALPTGTLNIANGATYELRVPGTGQPGAPMSFTGDIIGVVGSTFSFARGDATLPDVADYRVTLTPSVAPSAFAGALRADNVTLVMGADDILPTASIDLINGGVLDLNATTQSFTGLSGDATSKIKLSNGSLVFNVTDTAANPDLVFAGNIEGTGNINKEGAGTLSLRGVTTGTVFFNVNAGTLEATPDALGAGNGVIVASGATFAVRNDDTASPITFVNSVTGDGRLAKTGLGEVQMAAVAVLGGVAVQEGRLTITAATDSSVFRSVDISAGATYQVNLPAGGLIHDSDTLDAVTGAGNLAVSGPETLTLAGAATQSYTGNTELLNGASLAFGAGVTSVNGIAGDGTVILPATLTINQTQAGTFSGTFSGGGDVTVSGTGVLTLTDAATASDLGALTVDAGNLQVSGTNTKAVDLANNGTLLVNVASGTVAYTASVTGTGNLVKTGTGTLDYANSTGFTQTGTIGVAEGVFQIDPATLGGNVTGLTTNGAGTLALVIADIDNPATPAIEGQTLTLAVTGNGILEKTGSGQLKVNGGELAGFTGTLFVSQGRLGGNFTTGGNLVVGPAGTLAPGNSPGTVVVAGNFALNAGGTLEVEINASTSDQVIVSGSATLAGALAVKQDNTPGSTKPGKGQTYTILTAAGGITGAFSNAVGGVVQLAPDEIAKTGIARVRIQNTGTTLTMTTVGSIAGLAGLHDGTGGLVAAIDAGTLPTAVQTAVDGAAPGAVAKIVNNLSPLGYAAEYAMAQDADNRLHAALHDRLEQRRYDRASSLTIDEAEWEAFASATGSFADNKQATDTPTFNYRTFGGVVGLDKKVSDDLTVGAAVAYDSGTADIHDNGGKIEMSRATLTVFGGTQITSRWYVDGGLTAGYGQFDGKRETVLGKLKAKNDGMSVGGFIETGTIFAVTKDFHITPYAGVAYTHHEFDGFTESGNASALKVEGWSNDSLRAKIGSGFAWFVPLDEMKLKLGLDAAFAHELIDTDSDIEASFASGGSKFSTTAAALPQSSVALSPSIGLQIDESLSASFGYSYEMGFDGRSYQSVNFTVRKRF